MSQGVYVAGCEPATGKSAVALGVQQLLARRVGRLGVFHPVVADPSTIRCSSCCAHAARYARRRAASATRTCAPTRRGRSRRSSPATTRWRPVRRRARGRHGLRRRRHRPASSRSTRASRSTSGCRCCASCRATTARRGGPRGARPGAGAVRGAGCAVVGVIVNRADPERLDEVSGARRRRTSCPRSTADGADRRAGRGRLRRRDDRRRSGAAGTRRAQPHWSAR